MPLAENELLSLGQDDDNDIALADEGIAPNHVQIRHEDGVWQLLLLAPGRNEQGEALETDEWHPMPQAFQVGDVWLSVLPENSPMPDPATWLATGQREHEAAHKRGNDDGADGADGTDHGSEEAGRERHDDDDDDDDEDEDQRHTPGHTTWRASDTHHDAPGDDDDDEDAQRPPAAKLARHRRTSVLALVALGVCALLPRALGPGHLFHLNGSSNHTATTTATAKATGKTLAPATAQVQAHAPRAASASAVPLNPQLVAILALPRWSGLRATRRADGVELVSGSLPDRASYDALAAQLSRVVPRPALNVLTGEDVRDIVRSTLDDYAPTLNVDLDNKRHVTLSGAAMTPQQVDMVLGRLRHALPDYTINAGQIDFPTDVVRRTRADLAAAGLKQAEVQWDGQRIMVSGDFNAEQENALDGALHVLDERYRSRIPFTAHIAHAGDPGSGTTEASDNSLPFTIRSVVGGLNPYLMIADGTIISPGGTYRGWHLKAIEADRILFDSPRLLMVQR